MIVCCLLWALNMIRFVRKRGREDKQKRRKTPPYFSHCEAASLFGSIPYVSHPILALWPPSTGRITAVMKRASSEARKRAA